MKKYQQPQTEAYQIESCMALAASMLPASIDDPTISGSRTELPGVSEFPEFLNPFSDLN